jgi:hypothetical protein
MIQVLLSEPVVDPIASGYLIQTSPKLRYPGKRSGFAVNAAARHGKTARMLRARRRTDTRI